MLDAAKRLAKRREADWWTYSLGVVVAALMFLVMAALFLVDLASPDTDTLRMLREEGAARLGGGLVLSLLTFLPYWLLGVAASRERLARTVLRLVICFFVVDLCVRIRIIFFPQSSTDAIGLFFFPLWSFAFVAAVWLISKLFTVPD